MPRRSSLPVAALAAALGAILVLGGAALAQTQTPSSSPSQAPGADVTRAEDQVVLSGTVSVPRGRAVGEVVVFHGRAVVSGVVAGDVVVFDGPIAVSGQVSGSVVALNGSIRLGSTASIGGDVLGSQQVRLEPGAFVRGDVRDDVTITARGAIAALGALLGALAIAFSALLVLLLLLAIAPSADLARRDPEVATLAESAREAAVDQVVLNHFGGSEAPPEVRLVIRSFLGLVEAASREWLFRRRASRAQVEALLTQTLVALLRDALPAVMAAGNRTSRKA